MSDEKLAQLRRAALKLARRANVRKGENLLILADTTTDKQVVEAVFEASIELEALPTLLVQPYSKDNDMFAEPPKIVAAAMTSFPDVVIPLAKGCSPYTNTYGEMLRNSRVLGFIYPTVESMINLLLNIDYDIIDKISDTLTELLANTRVCRFTSTAGTDITMAFGGRHIADDPGRVARKGDENYLPGACVCVAPLEESWEGTIVYDALAYPPIGTLANPIRLVVSHGVVQRIEGGEEAKRFRKWLEDFDDQNMFRMCHIGIGINPQFNKLTGIKTLDERIYGIVGAGLGTNDIPVFEGTIRAKAHTDGYMRCASVYLDGVPLVENGKFVHLKLKDYSDAGFCMRTL